MADAVDDSEFEVPQDTDRLARITLLVEKAFDLDMEIAELNRQVEIKNGKLRELKEKDIPDLMAEVGITVVGVPGHDDMTCEVVQFVHASIPKSGEVEAFKWLEDNEHGDLIKNSLIVDFNKEDAEAAKRIYDRVVQMVAQEEISATPILKKGVHHMTLTAFVKEQLSEGQDVPLATLGATVGNIAKFKEKRNGKKAKART